MYLGNAALPEGGAVPRPPDQEIFGSYSGCRGSGTPQKLNEFNKKFI